jgi:hypothetical protein
MSQGKLRGALSISAAVVREPQRSTTEGGVTLGWRSEA